MKITLIVLAALLAAGVVFSGGFVAGRLSTGFSLLGRAPLYTQQNYGMMGPNAQHFGRMNSPYTTCPYDGQENGYGTRQPRFNMGPQMMDPDAGSFYNFPQAFSQGWDACH
ncbi:MAG: hypothetical protein VB089_03475 [Anaerolineaceae bacterium]|nr:hypothetical protein [Anaerolineaceae bacterium]